MSNRIPWAVLLSAALIPLGAMAEDPSAPQNPKPEKVTKLNGVSLFGIVEVTDDYTVRVKSDTGIQKVPIAQLGDGDFKKFGFKKDRSQDGKFWSERQDALKKEKETNSNEQDDAAIEIKLTEIAPFQPLIDAYEKSLANKKADEASQARKKDQANETPGRSLFSKTGIPGMGNQPFTGMAGSAVQPAASAGATAVQSAAGVTGVMGGLPTAP